MERVPDTAHRLQKVALVGAEGARHVVTRDSCAGLLEYELGEEDAVRLACEAVFGQIALNKVIADGKGGAKLRGKGESGQTIVKAECRTDRRTEG